SAGQPTDLGAALRTGGWQLDEEHGSRHRRGSPQHSLVHRRVSLIVPRCASDAPGRCDAPGLIAPHPQWAPSVDLVGPWSNVSHRDITAILVCKQLQDRRPRSKRLECSSPARRTGVARTRFAGHDQGPSHARRAAALQLDPRLFSHLFCRGNRDGPVRIVKPISPEPRNQAMRTSVLLSTLVLVFAAVYFAAAIVAPVTFALFIVAVVWPVQSALETRIPKLLALVVTILATLAVIAALVLLLVWGF